MPIGVNLIDWRRQQRRRRLQIAGSCLLGAAALAVAVTAMIGARVAQSLDSHRHAVAELEQSIDGLADGLARVEALEQDIATLRQRLEHKTAIRRHRRAIQAGLAAAAQSRPSHTQLRRLVITPRQLTVEGITRHPTDAPQMAKRLERHPQLEQADVARITPNADTGGARLRFRLRASLLAGPADADSSTGPGGGS
jgi:Tfp pilus assembly protein PilN